LDALGAFASVPERGHPWHDRPASRRMGSPGDPSWRWWAIAMTGIEASTSPPALPRWFGPRASPDDPAVSALIARVARAAGWADIGGGFNLNVRIELPASDSGRRSGLTGDRERHCHGQATSVARPALRFMGTTNWATWENCRTAHGPPSTWILRGCCSRAAFEETTTGGPQVGRPHRVEQKRASRAGAGCPPCNPPGMRDLTTASAELESG
jgi:hypothetical protein